MVYKRNNTPFIPFDINDAILLIIQGETVATKEEGGGVTGINRLQVVLTRYDLAAQWQCRVNSPALTVPLTSDLHIDVHGRFHRKTVICDTSNLSTNHC